MRSRWTDVGQKPASRGGVYAVYVDGALTYIGMTRNVQARLYQHRDWIDGRPFTVKVSYDDDIDSRVVREGRLIRRVRPSRNRATRDMHPGQPRALPRVSLFIKVSLDVNHRLRERAQLKGMTVNALASRALTQAASRWTNKKAASD